jgi:hypothetical protein
MKTLLLIECKCCGSTHFGDSHQVIIEPEEQLSVIVKKIAYCFDCKTRSNRTQASVYKKKL